MSYASEVLADAPAVYYQGQETSGTVAVDSSGNGRNGSWGGTVALADTTDPALPTYLGGQHVRLNGTNGHLVIENGTWFNPGPNGFTVEGWFYIRSHGGFARLFDFANSGSTSDIYFAPLGTSLGWLTVAGSSKTDVPILPTASWRHVVVTVTAAGQATVYVDGSQTYTSAIVAPNANPRALRYIGRSVYPSDPYLAASLAHVAVYTKALTSTRVAAHYTAATTPGAITGTLAGAIPAPTLAASGTAAPPSVSGSFAGSVPGPTLAATGSATVPGSAGTFASTVPAPTLAVSGTATAPASVAGTFAGTIPAPTLALAGTAAGASGGGGTTTGTSTEYANEGYTYTGAGLVEYEPAVAPVPPRLTRHDVRRIHVHMPPPDLVNGRPQ